MVSKQLINTFENDSGHLLITCSYTITRYSTCAKMDWLHKTIRYFETLLMEYLIIQLRVVEAADTVAVQIEYIAILSISFQNCDQISDIPASMHN